MAESTAASAVSTALTTLDPAALRLELGLGAAGLALDLAPGALPLDQNPWLADVCALRIGLLGHEDRLPRPWDWDNLLSLLEPDEELLWIIDFRRSSGDRREHIEAHLALKFGGSRLAHASVPAERRRRFQAVASHFCLQAFPESKVEPLGPQDTWLLLQRGASEPAARTVCVAGMPSPRDHADDAGQIERQEETRAWQSLNDVVETCLGLDTGFRLVFTVARMGDEALDREFARVTSLRDELHPLVNQQRQQTDMLARTSTEQSGSTEQEGGSQKEGDYPWAETIRRFLNVGRWIRHKDIKADTRPTHTWGKTATSSHSEGTTATRTEGLTLDELRTDLLLADETLERTARSLYEARGTGGFRGAVLITASGSSTDVIASAVRGVLSGSRSKDHPLGCFEITGDSGSLIQSTTPTLALLAPALPVLQLDQACHMLLLPEAELPGLPLQRSVFLGRNATPPGGGSGTLVSLGQDAFLDGTGGRARRAIELPAEDLFRHVLVAGTTGSGKTRRVLKILEALDVLGEDLRVIVFETAKRTYREEFQRLAGPSPRIYTLGEATAWPLRLNPFDFEPGTSLKRHVSVLSDALGELMPTEAMIGPYLRQAVEQAYLRCGWDIESGQAKAGESARVPSVIDFVHEVRRVAAELDYGAEVGANYRGALEARARLFLDATFQDIFSAGAGRTVEEIFDRDTIIELEALPPSEIDVPAFLLSLLLERLRAHQLQALERDGRPRGWLVVVEEAHNVLSRENEGRLDGGESNGGRTLLTRVVRLLQEGRELRIGVMVVDQAPAMLARGVLKNANTKIAMRLEDHEEMREMGQALSLDEDRWADLGLLRTGEAIVKATYMRQPVKSGRFDVSELPVKVDEARRDPMTGVAPQYVVLEERWTDALVGHGAAPDQPWLDAQLTAACGDPEILRFGLGRALLAAREDPHSAHLLDTFHTLPSEPAALLELARSTHARAQGHALGHALLPLERRLFSAEVEGSWSSDWARPSSAAIRLAAETLARSPDGEAYTSWELALLGLALADDSDWSGASEALRRLRDDRGMGQLHSIIRLRCLAARLQAHPLVAATASSEDALQMQLLARQLLDEVSCKGEADADRTAAAGAMVRILTRAQGRQT